MNAYILSVLGVVLFSSLVTAIIPDGKTASFIKGIARLVCVFAIVSPLISFFQEGKESGDGENFFVDSVIKTDETYIDYCSKISVKNAETELQNTVEKDYGISCDIHLIWQYEKKDTDGLKGFFLINYEGKSIKVEEIQINFPIDTSTEMQNNIISRLQTDTSCEVKIVA